jgi:hypothetical protein
MTIKRVLVSFLVFMLVTATVAYAANKILVSKGTALLFADAAQAEDVTLTMSAIAAGAGQCSNQYTKTGANVKSQNWEMRVHLQLTGTNVVGEVVEFYVATSNGTYTQGAIGSTNAALSSNARKNLTFAGVLIVDQTATNTNMIAAFDVTIKEALFQVCFWNATTLPLKTDTAVHGIQMTPMDIEIQ